MNYQGIDYSIIFNPVRATAVVAPISDNGSSGQQGFVVEAKGGLGELARHMANLMSGRLIAHGYYGAPHVVSISGFHEKDERKLVSRLTQNGVSVDLEGRVAQEPARPKLVPAYSTAPYR